MKKKQLLLSAIISIVVVFVVQWFIYKSLWRFDISNIRHWNMIVDKWNNDWIVSSKSEFLFLGGIILMPVFMGILTLLVYKIVFTKSSKPKKKKTSKVTDAKYIPSDLVKSKQNQTIKKVLPKKLSSLRGVGGPVQNNTVQTNNVVSEPQQTNAPAPKQQSSVQQTQANKAMSSIEIADYQVGIWKNLASVFEKAGMYILQDMPVGELNANIISFSQSGIFLLCAGPEKGNVWKVNDMNGRATWTTEDGEEIPSPFVNMDKAKKLLKSYIENNLPEYAQLEVNACMMMDHGYISNMTDMLSYIEGIDVSVLRMGQCTSKELPDTGALIEFIKSQGKSSSQLNDDIAGALLDLQEA
ncbi:MAG: hypothetical protein MJ247_04270 [Alphaproteobacteria bacterium]|nr:hypothetical protein [Alphaproteobacteria bacterium]